MARERFTPRDKKIHKPPHDRLTGQRTATGNEQLGGQMRDQDFDLRKPQPDQAAPRVHPVSVRETIAGHNHYSDVRHQQYSGADSVHRQDDFRSDTAPGTHDDESRSFRQAPSYEGASERQSLSETNRRQQGTAYHSRFAKPVEDRTPAPDALPDTVRISDEAKAAEHFHESTVDNPLPEHPGRLRFDDTAKPDSKTVTSSQHSSAYSQRFTTDTKQPESAGTEAPASATPDSEPAADPLPISLCRNDPAGCGSMMQPILIPAEQPPHSTVRHTAGALQKIKNNLKAPERDRLILPFRTPKKAPILLCRRKKAS